MKVIGTHTSITTFGFRMTSLGGVDCVDDLLASQSGFTSGGDIAKRPIFLRVCDFGSGGVPEASDL